MFNSKTKMLLAALLGAAGVAQAGPYGKFGTRTVKIRPANYTHPMIVSSPAEIAAWNRDVKKQKVTRIEHRFDDRQKIVSQLIAAEVSVSYAGLKGLTAGLRKQAKQVSYGVAIARRTGLGHIDRSAV